jgi:hypothetical protein
MIEEERPLMKEPLMTNKIFPFLLFIFVLQNQAFAEGGGQGFDFGLSTLRYSHSTTYAASPASETSATHLDLKVGYVMSTGFYLGGAYSTFTDYNLGATVSTENRTGVGLVLGYHDSGYYIDWTLLLSSQLDRADGSKYTGGLSTILSGGYNAMFGSSFYLGVGVSYKNFNWTEQTDPAGVKTLVTNMQSEFFPCLNLGFIY